ncbi:hypothetical protein GTR02_20600 [Kineococcus sp. R8]|nr:hypothetical protein [Kineococcus siccus]
MQEQDVPTPARGVLAWVLVVGASAPALLTADVVRRVLGGALDTYYGNQYDAAQPEITLSQRWEWLQYTAFPETGALASALALVVVAAVVVARRPRALVPPRPARWLAAAAGGVTALLGLGTLTGLLTYAARSQPGPEEVADFGRSTPEYLVLAPRAGIALLAAVLAVTATVVLLRTPAEPEGPVAGPVEEEAPAPGEPAVDPEGEQGNVAAAAPAATSRVVARAPEPPCDPAAELPRLRAEELALYRRPR